jgi:hypothetical protein
LVKSIDLNVRISIRATVAAKRVVLKVLTGAGAFYAINPMEKADSSES